ncbi:Glutamate decarboxylase 2 [Cyanidiococcus yangmingshanensis]|uniref:Glutamate decarboxylase 2 n=1 Tax=Cyanidiococcus yangmingshanensis TaxID=2690220 RepID=A0A7J7IN98_9RHOD|nr:Glutamate decarboxylase 2 [Cyanidiococcus yangmingshanensis]
MERVDDPKKLDDQGLEVQELVASEFRELVQIVERKVEQYLFRAERGRSENGPTTDGAPRPLVSYQRPETIEHRMEGYVHQIMDGESVRSRAVLECFLDDLLRYSVRTSHAYFLHRLYGASDPMGQVAELLLSVLNNSPDTFSAAPFLVVLERRLIQALCERIGWETLRQGDGLFCPGGSYANLLAMTSARHAFHESSSSKRSEHGHRHHCCEPRMGVFTSEQGHYSVRRNASILGLCDAPGEACSDVFLVPCDEAGRMDVEALRQMLHCFRRSRPESSVFVNRFRPAAGSMASLRRGFQLNAAHALNADHDAESTKSRYRPRFWIHVDGALGGSFLFSTQFRSVALSGLEAYADSFVLNAHKLLGAPLQCSVLLVRERGLLLAAHAARASYLFHDEFDPDARYDIGDMTLTCSRRSDALKFWLMWMWRGNQAVWNARRIAEAMMQRPCFLLVGWSRVQPYPATNVCFYFLPPELRGRVHSSADVKTCAEREQLARLSVRLCRALQVAGKALLNYCTLGRSDLPTFLRLALHGAHIYHDERVRDLLDVMERFGDRLCIDDATLGRNDIADPGSIQSSELADGFREHASQGRRAMNEGF